MKYKYCYNQNCELSHVSELCNNICNAFKEKPVIQFDNENQVLEFFHTGLNALTNEAFLTDKNINMDLLKKAGYIRKSNLAQLVEESEEMYMSLYISDDIEKLNQIIEHMRATIQAFKKAYPEYMI